MGGKDLQHLVSGVAKLYGECERAVELESEEGGELPSLNELSASLRAIAPLLAEGTQVAGHIMGLSRIAGALQGVMLGSVGELVKTKVWPGCCNLAWQVYDTETDKYPPWVVPLVKHIEEGKLVGDSPFLLRPGQWVMLPGRGQKRKLKSSNPRTAVGELAMLLLDLALLAAFEPEGLVFGEVNEAAGGALVHAQAPFDVSRRTPLAAGYRPQATRDWLDSLNARLAYAETVGRCFGPMGFVIGPLQDALANPRTIGGPSLDDAASLWADCLTAWADEPEVQSQVAVRQAEAEEALRHAGLEISFASRNTAMGRGVEYPVSASRLMRKMRGVWALEPGASGESSNESEDEGKTVGTVFDLVFGPDLGLIKAEGPVEDAAERVKEAAVAAKGKGKEKADGKGKKTLPESEQRTAAWDWVRSLSLSLSLCVSLSLSLSLSRILLRRLKLIVCHCPPATLPPPLYSFPL